MRDIDDIHGAGGGGGKGGGGGGSQRTPRESANTLRSAATARVIDMLGEGPIVGLVNGLQSVYLDETPLQDASGAFNFQGVTVHTRDGDPEQARIPGFAAVESETEVNAQVRRDQPLVRTVSNLNADAVRIKIRLQALTYQDPKTGDLKGSSVSLAVDVRPQGGSWSEQKRINIRGKTTSPYERQTRVDLSGEGPWDVRVRRLTADSDKANPRNDTDWSSYTTLVDARLTYPDCALVGLEVDARQFGTSIPKRAYDVKGRIIRVPSNYNPETREYTGLWDGTFQLAWTDNPAWIYYDLATHVRYGAALENVDKWSLYDIGQHCDELVPDGYGGMEPRFTVNTVLASEEEAMTALNQLASAFRGMTYWGTNATVAVADKPSDPVKLVHPGNVVDGEFEYSGTALRARHSVALITWNDPQDNYRQQVEVVEDADAIREFGWRQTDVTAFGCTSRGQAHRMGKWILDSERAETETVSYQASVDHADLRPGDIIEHTNPDRAGARMGGRLKATSPTSVTLDKVPDVIDGSVWYLDVMRPNGTIERQEVASFSGNDVTLAAPLSAEPVPNAGWILSSESIKPRLFRVMGVSEADDGIYEISAVEHDPTKYARVEQNLILPKRETSLIPTGPLPPPGEMDVEEYLYRAGPSVKSGITLSISSASDPRITLHEVEMFRPGESDFEALSLSSRTTIDVRDTEPGEYQFRARSVSGVGQRSPWRTQTFGVQGLLAPPSNVEDLRISVNNGQVLLEWPAVPDLDLSHYRVRYNASATGATWANSQDVADQVPAGATNLMLPARRGTYLIKAVDTSGGASLNATRATSTIAELVGTNVVETVDESPMWAGTHTDTIAINGALQLASGGTMSEWETLADVPNLTHGVSGVASEGYYEAAEVVDLGHVYTCRLSGELLADGFDVLGVMASWPTLAEVVRLDLSEVSQWGITLEVSMSQTPQPAAPTDWSEWQTFKVGEYEARALRFRLRLQSFAAAITPRVERMRLAIDMPDRVADGQDLTCPPEGVRVLFEPAFMARPSLAVDAQGLAPGERKRITNISDEGFDIEFLDDADNGVERSFDYLAKGYGRRVA
ncbi:Phage-related protein, tail component [Vreelandella subterranea]|uniref:Phage-related protein, tail component n=1 Tax=Vreelandella subterranea TaxID=416874 RepID=A0A1H9UUL4_9GAMM|nr:phage tail protein [Halomonas subterranea]SES12747.1 Phage-related protein, tail component [Halomonas subterranea]